MAQRDVILSAKPCVYILRCANGKYYVGSTTNLKLRMKEHQEGKGCGFTKAHLPVELVYTEDHDSAEQAYNRERQIHRWSHAKKEALIKGDFDLLKKLSKST